MTDNNYALPWRAEDNGLAEYMVVDSDNDVVAYVAAAGDEECARLMEISANYHHRLREALISCAEQLDDDDPDSRCMDNIVSDKAHKLLAELDNLENGS